MVRKTIKNRNSYYGVIVLTVAAVALGWMFAYRQMSVPSTSNPTVESSNPVVSGTMAPAAFGRNIIFNAAAGNSIKVTLRGDVETSTIANPLYGQFLMLLICQDAVGARLMSWPGNVRLAGGVLTLASEPNQCDAVTMVYDGTYWHETARALQLASPHEMTLEPSEPLLQNQSQDSPPE
jgi:hypothetical protein